MTKNTILLFILLAFVCFSAQVNGQDSLKTQPKNVIYANVGKLFSPYLGYANYERLLFSTYIKFYIRASAGVFTELSDFKNGYWSNVPYGSLSMQGVFGLKESHLELGLGLSTILYISFPTVSVGYRYQKPTGGFIFRSGIGFPDGIYLSLGLAF